MPDSVAHQKYRALLDRLATLPSLAVAFSGGADSSLLLHAAHVSLGHRVQALFADSQVQPPGEREHAAAVAASIGVPLTIVVRDVLAVPGFTANPANRCYLCKRALYAAFHALPGVAGIALLADGTNADDLTVDRPGLAAVRELGVLTPLAEAGLTKAEVRILSRELGLSTWNRLSNSCLATRIAIGESIDVERLETVRLAEAELHAHGFPGCRVRLRGEEAVVELVEGGGAAFCSSAAHAGLKKILSSRAVAKVLLDLSERAGNVL